MICNDKWTELWEMGYTVVRPEYPNGMLDDAKKAVAELSDDRSNSWTDPQFPGDLWREIPGCKNPALLALKDVLDPLANELLRDGSESLDHVQLASAPPGHVPMVGRRGHIDGGGEERAFPASSMYYLVWHLPKSPAAARAASACCRDRTSSLLRRLSGALIASLGVPSSRKYAASSDQKDWTGVCLSCTWVTWS
jgi:hypothetical protein